MRAQRASNVSCTAAHKAVYRKSINDEHCPNLSTAPAPQTLLPLHTLTSRGGKLPLGGKHSAKTFVACCTEEMTAKLRGILRSIEAGDLGHIGYFQPQQIKELLAPADRRAAGQTAGDSIN